MSTVASALSLQGTRQSGQSVRTQNGKKMTILGFVKNMRRYHMVIFLHFSCDYTRIFHNFHQNSSFL